MLKRFRIEKGLEARQVCRGLCSPAAMSYFESGERMPDTLMFEYMMERMGVTPELFSMMVSSEEYEYYDWREQVCEAIANRDFGRLKPLLDETIAKETFDADRFKKQFYLYANAIAIGVEGQYKESVVKLDEALKQTIPNIHEISNKQILLSVLELYMLMLYLYYGVKSKVHNIEDSIRLFEILETYIYCGRMDLNDKSKCYARLISIATRIFHNSFTDERQKELCERAIQLLRTDMSFFDITEILEIYVPLLGQHDAETLGFFTKQYEVFKDIIETEDISTQFCPEQFRISKPKYYIIHEYLSSHRVKNALTQEELSEGVCEPETYSRVEGGKRTPSRKNFQELASRLKINWCYFRGELDTADLKVYELYRLQRTANINGNRQLCLDILADMEERLDMTCVANIQYIKSNEYVALYRMGRISPEDAYSKLKTLLELTQQENGDVSRLVYYSQTEIELIAHMAQILQRMKQPRKGIEIIETVIKQMKYSKVRLTDQWNGFSFVLRVLNGLYFEIGEYEMAIRIAKYVKQETVKRRTGDSLPNVLDAIADGLEHLGAQYSEEYKKLYRYTFYVSDLFLIGKIKEPAKQYYEEKFENGMKWY